MSDLYQLPPRHPSERSISDINKAANRDLQSFDEIREEDSGTPMWLDDVYESIRSIQDEAVAESTKNDSRFKWTFLLSLIAALGSLVGAIAGIIQIFR